MRILVVAILMLSGAATAGASGDAGLALAAVYRRDVDLERYNHAVSMAVSPDGAYLYVGSGFSATLTLARDVATGTLEQIQTVPDEYYWTSMVVTPDGRNLYACISHTIAHYDRDPLTGLLTEVAEYGGIDWLAD